MWQYVFHVLRRQLGTSTLVSGGFMLAACALILLSATTQTTLVRGNQIISQNWRPTYDLAVLPKQAKVPTAQQIPSDALSGYGTGITMQQYQQIENLPGIEVAAPIALVGYIQMPVPQIYFSDHNYPTGYYQIDWTLTAFNGQRNIVQSHERQFIYIISGIDPSSVTSQSPKDVFDAFGDKISEAISEVDNSPTSVSPMGTGTFQLTGIDPTAENRLVHLNKSVTTGRMLTEQDTVHLDTRIPDNPYTISHPYKTMSFDAIPMLLHRQLPGQVMLHATFTLLYRGSMTAAQIAANGGIGYLQQRADKQILFDGTVPLVQNDPQRFSGHGLLWNGHTWQDYIPTSDYGPALYYTLDFSGASTPAGLAYTRVTAPDGGTAYELVPKGIQGGEGTFRTLKSLHTVKSTDILGPGDQVVTYNYEAVGEFTNNGLVAQINNPLNWLPENTYSVPPVISRYDAQGHPVPATTFLPTTNPAGFLMQPPLALTTISAAKELVGNACISAIRVRVAGVVTPSQESWKRIQQVAQEIRQQTGLQVVITLGSSPQPTLVYVPGIQAGTLGATQNIAPVGWVEERWLHIGVGLVYLNQLGSTQILLLGSVLAVCLGYLAVAFSSLVSSQRRDFAVLSMLGWRPWQPIRLFLVQTLVLALGGGIVGLGLALLIAAFLGVTPFWIIVLWTLPVMLAFALISTLYPLWQIWHIRPAELIRTGSSISSGKTSIVGSSFTHFVGMLMPIGSLVLRNVSRSRTRALLALLSLFFSALLLMIMFNSLLAQHQALQGTLLGDYVLLQTAVPQIAGCVIALVLTFLSVADLLLLQVRERQKEIGLFHAIGWHPWAIQRLFVQEGLLLVIAGTIPGVLVSLWVLSVQHVVQHIVSVPLIACCVVALMILVATLAILPTMRAVSRVRVVELLRAE